MFSTIDLHYSEIISNVYEWQINIVKQEFLQMLYFGPSRFYMGHMPSNASKHFSEQFQSQSNMKPTNITEIPLGIS